MQEFWLLPAILAVVWFWLDSMRAHEAALVVARRACDRHDVQLLDQTVVLVRLRLGRDGSGRVNWRRRFRFEFSAEGDTRRGGELELLGRRVTALQLELGPFVLYEMDADEQTPTRH